ncbi:lipocalin family protein [Campylobacter coli]|nr:biotin transporter BioY [Campylobacter coli]EAH9382766.1 biotin transporter BioY [Campylobacter coli]EAH9954741.1 biotin transporter BioY [Campylobacter coli]EAJ6781399.1 biotin transporter BioY [Campylobacter coli]EAJ9453646.1 biotin transporter BioY [Campylobacter coli]
MIELIGDVNLEKYMGTWLEMARKSAFFQKSCVQSKAEYQLEYEGSTPVVNIKNICVKKDGEVSQVQGKAKVKSPRALSVKFSIFMNLFNKTNYEILFIDTNYEVAVVGSPDKEYLWILSRKIIDKKEIDKLLDIAKQKGFDISDIVFDKY